MLKLLKSPPNLVESCSLCAHRHAKRTVVPLAIDVVEVGLAVFEYAVANCTVVASLWGCNQAVRPELE